jgi:4,4'-diaponeurosporenoate glycosyltransferase
MAELVLVVVLLGAGLGARWLLATVPTVPSVPAGRCVARADRDEPAAVSVVVPARDEEATLPVLLGSLRRLRTPPREVLVVDDASRDDTAAVARAGGAVVLPAGAPPRGWTGKAWACHVGAGASGGDLLLFLDADTVLAPEALDDLLALHARYGGLVSVQPFHEVVRPYEQLSAYFNVVALLGSSRFGRRPGRRAMAFGPCLLTSRADHARAGGHAAVRAEILDDVGLASAYRRAGLPVHWALGGESVRMRSYPGGIRQLVAGWSKNVASGAAAAARGPALATVLWVCAHHAVAVGVGLALLGAATGQHPSVARVALWSVGYVVAAWQLRSLLRRTGSFRWWTWALFPVPLLVFDLVFARSAVLTTVRRSVRWRGRPVDLRRYGSTQGGA